MKPETKNKMNAVLVKLLVSAILIASFYAWFTYRLNDLVETSSSDVAKPIIKVIEKDAPLK